MTQTTVPPSGRSAGGAGKSSLLMRTGYVIGAVALAAELLMAVAPAALAAPDPSRVHIADLDLNSDIDIAVLERRIATAARAACRTPDRVGDPIIGYRRCIADTSASARAQLDQAIRRSRSDAAPSTASGRAGAAR